MTIRAATKKDFNTIVNLLIDAYKESEAYQSYNVSIERAGKFIASLIESPTGVILLSEDGSDVQGILICHMETRWFTDERGLFEDLLYVVPRYRGTTVVFELIEKLVEIAEFFQIKRVTAGASLHPDKADGLRRIYESYGFKTFTLVFEKEL